MSPANEPVVEALWSESAAKPSDYLSGITGMNYDAAIGPEERFLYYLDTIDLHHGPESADHPYLVLEVLGLPLSAPVCQAISEYGFDDIVETPDGFVATRSAEEVNRDRD
jgi:hypothetical protein